MPELRKDPVLGRWVIVSTERVRRPADFAVARSPRRPGPCPLCPGREAATPPALLELPPDAGTVGWSVRVVPNKFPALRIEGDLGRRGQGLYDLMNGVGAHEVVVESPDHDDDLGTMSVAAIDRMLGAVQTRMLDLQRDTRFRSILYVRTRGLPAGPHLDHPHGQLLATPVVPLLLATELLHARTYHDYRERCLFCDIVRQEVAERERVVVASPHAIAFAPFASARPFAVWIMPRRHAARFPGVLPAERAEIAAALRTVVQKLDALLGPLPLTIELHGAPVGEDESPSFHWHLELVPTTSPVGEVVPSPEFPLNPLPPEDAARLLRDATP